MEEESTLDFKALMDKFQDKELLKVKEPSNNRPKPALPEKPKVVPPPQSPSHYMPTGAKPSLLTSINNNLESKTPVAPRVVFKDEKKASKKPLIQTKSKTKESKLKVGKDKSKSKEKIQYEPLEPKPKKDSKEKKKESTAVLVPATAPPKNSAFRKKGFLGLKKTSKRDSWEVPSELILDSSSLEVSGPVPLVPALTPPPVDLIPPPVDPIPPRVDPIPPVDPIPTPVELIPPPVELIPPPDFIPEVPASPESPALESETNVLVETLNISRPSSQNKVAPSVTPPLITADQEVYFRATIPSPELEAAAEGPIDLTALEIPPPSVGIGLPASPKSERPLSALSVLERAEEMSPGKSTPPGDQRIFNALEKARRMAQGLSKPASPLPVSPSPEENPDLQPDLHPDLPDGLTQPLYELPPIDYENKMGKYLLPKPEEVNGLDHRSSLVLEGISDEDVPEKPEVPPPPPPKRVQSISEPLGPPPTPPRPLSEDLSASFNPSPVLEDNAVLIPVPVEFSEPETDVGPQADVLVFENVTPEAHSPELPVSECANGDDHVPDSPVGPPLPDHHGNGIALPAAEVNTTPVFEEEVPQSPSNRDSLMIMPGGQAENNPYESTENVYEDVTSKKDKKGKSDGKKRKGPPKNPYAEAQEAAEEKTKTGRFGKADKKASATAEGPDEKELKKREKQRLEKEKKEMKERQEREKKEQKEREKRENEMKKKFKITGQEDTMYQAKVTVTTKGRKHDLPVKAGDTISIIRTTNCPKGKWLARDSTNNYGYVAVNHVELDIKEMLELGKKSSIHRKISTEVIEPEATSTGSRASNHYPNESFTDDSEEWTCDDDEPVSPVEHIDPQLPMGHTRALSMPDMGDMEDTELPIIHQYSQSELADGSQIQARHGALQRLSTFFADPSSSAAEPDTTHEVVEEIMEDKAPMPEASTTEEIDFENPNVFFIPPPEQYADYTEE